MWDVLIIGSGAAAYATADWLHVYGVENVAIVTESRTAGTSRNTGSDKQTYFKLALDYNSCDSVYSAAKALYRGGGMDGDIALQEAANSVRCFLHLVEYGVDFPTDKLGAYIGYRTDHDEAMRASSVGPYTSAEITRKLENVVIQKNKTKLLDGLLAVKIITEGGRAVGVVAVEVNSGTVQVLPAKYVVLATGAPCAVYGNSVYPTTQHGMTGMAIEAGAQLANFSEWQYGLASVNPKWNVSGSYQQVIPRYVAVDEAGQEYEFLADGDKVVAYTNVFKKGYEWPFDTAKVKASSAIDLAVIEQNALGRKVYLDYRINPTGLDFSLLGEEINDYLRRNEAFANTPYERLVRLNPQAVRHYCDNGIDLSHTMLEITVCAQHNNGGLAVDTNRETTVKGLYAAGEVAGTFGVYRPGGAALNSTQVSGLIIAQRLAEKTETFPDSTAALARDKAAVSALITQCLAYKAQGEQIMEKLREAMSRWVGICRNEEEIIILKNRIKQLLATFSTWRKAPLEDMAKLLADRDTLLSALALCVSVLGTMGRTGSRGGALYYRHGAPVAERKGTCGYVFVTCGEKVALRRRIKLSLPKPSFEKEWKEHVIRTAIGKARR